MYMYAGLAHSSVLGTSSWCTPNDVVHTQDHFGRFGSGLQYLPLNDIRLGDAQLLHASHFAQVHVQSAALLSTDMCSAQLSDQLGRIVTSVIGNDGGQLQECAYWRVNMFFC